MTDPLHEHAIELAALVAVLRTAPRVGAFTDDLADSIFLGRLAEHGLCGVHPRRVNRALATAEAELPRDMAVLVRLAKLEHLFSVVTPPADRDAAVTSLGALAALWARAGQGETEAAFDALTAHATALGFTRADLNALVRDVMEAAAGMVATHRPSGSYSDAALRRIAAHSPHTARH